MIQTHIGYNCDQLSLLNHADTVGVIKEACLTGRLIVKHPILGIETECVASAERGINNILKFTDSKGENDWYLLQVSSFIDGWICGDKYKSYGGQLLIIQRVLSWIKVKSLQFSSSPSTSRKIDGLVLSGNRPFHYFHDRYIDAAELSLNHQLSDYMFRGDNCFISDLPVNDGGVKLRKARKDGCYLASCIRKDSIDATQINQASQFISSYYRSTEKKPENELTIWIGITSQADRRMWIEQIEGISSFIHYIATRTDKSLVIVLDGWTSYAEKSGDNSEISSDQKIVDQITQNCASISKLTVQSLVGANYQTKVATALQSDLAITNDCSGAIITYTICRRPCIMHGNKVIKSIEPELKYPDARSVDYTKITTIDGPKPTNMDYSMNWELLIPEVLTLLSKHINAKTT